MGVTVHFYKLFQFKADLSRHLETQLLLCQRTYNCILTTTRRLHRRSLRLPTKRKWAQSGYLCTTAQAGADAGFSWS